MIPIAILLAIALAASLCSWMEYRLMTRVTGGSESSGKRRPGKVIEINSRRVLGTETHGIHLVIENEF